MITECFYYTSVATSQIIALNPPPVSPPVAYLDPGTGSLIIQMAIGVAVGGLVTLKVFWKRLTALCKNMVSRERRDEPRG